jgi:hypothetical protein
MQKAYKIPPDVSSTPAIIYQQRTFLAFLIIFVFIVACYYMQLISQELTGILVAIELLSVLLIFIFFPNMPPNMEVWILKNVPCPQCGGQLTKCKCTVLFRSGNSCTLCEVYCKNCNKKFIFQEAESLMDVFPPRKLVFVKETKEDIAKLAHPPILSSLLILLVLILLILLAIRADSVEALYLSNPAVMGIIILLLILLALVYIKDYKMFNVKY